MPASSPTPFVPTHLPDGYRPDVDGLRGIAVLAVLFYHFRVPGFAGGFVGVDIFFVLSGYLITRIVAAEIAAGQFSIARFYERRVRRLFPALFVLLSVVTVAGWFFLLPREYGSYGKSLISVVLTGPNFYLWLVTANYFGAVAETLPLLHTWSLGVEEQFYLAFPLWLLLVLRYPRAALIAVAVPLILSLGLALWLVGVAPTAAFYIPPTRAWELLLGGLLALRLETGSRPPAWVAPAAGWAGLALIALAVSILKPWTPMPGAAALLPCCGTALAILAGRLDPANPAARILSWRPLVGVGLISYSLYLWHWPIYVLLRHHIVLRTLDWSWTLAGMASALAMAFLSWRFVERPVRGRQYFATRRALFAGAAAGAVLLLAAGLGLIVTDGARARFPGLKRYELDYDAPLAVHCSARHLASDPACRSAAAPADQRRVLVWGDSFAYHYASAAHQMKDRFPFAIGFRTAAGCPPVLGFDAPKEPTCKPANAKIFGLIEETGIDTVILAARWEAYRDRLEWEKLGATVRALQARGLTVIVFGQSPVFYFDFPDGYHYMRVRAGAPPRDGRAPNSIAPEFNAEIRDAAKPAFFFDPTPALCRGDSCLYREDDRYLVRKTSHLTNQGARKVLDLFLKSRQFGRDADYWRQCPRRANQG